MAGLNDDPDRYAYLAEGNAKQARKRIAAKVVIRDGLGRVLLVNPTYKDYWDLPGGMVESNESPSKGAEREILEEVGIVVTIGRVLLTVWIGPHGPWDDQILFVFDGAALTPQQLADLRVVDPEISEFGFFQPDEAARQLRPDMAERLGQALDALSEGTTTNFV
ncbi:NUDIX domain-containing protein [Kibdelosporangium aridum]|uniref:ADP-ribose pyrophosphatase YjhB, NUDIX family n=1 Tax=Kibdelosporangium aridum TaxID=2030 RepID=A0A1W2G0L4_KIBAR|nr:NUDIX hydrolase [Kibdelosporangium aridum]SMD27426.1 ADP-ribose pyrophosphatase YjhB, NUDIX family [Kibdelosporangium aridum]